MANPKITIGKELLVTRIKENLLEESRLVGKIIRQVKSAKKNPQTRLNINEPQLRAHLQAEIAKWESRKIPKIINQFLAEVKLSFQKGENITLQHYFSFRIRRAAARKARNPRTGEMLMIPEQNRISFRASRKLKREIN